MSLVLPAPSGLPDGLPKVHPSEPAGTDKDLLAQLAKQLGTNGEMLEAMLKKRVDQILAINKIEALALSASPFVKRTGGVRYSARRQRHSRCCTTRTSSRRRR